MSDRLATISAALRRMGCTPADAVALAILAAATAVSLGLLWVLAGASPVSGPASAPAAAASDAPSEAGGIDVTAGDVIVHVAGAVRRPGVYTLPGGSRVGDAVTAAGGPVRRAVVDGLNLARVVADGEQVLVPRKGQVSPPTAGATVPGASGPAPAPAPGAAAVVSLNQATIADLETLPNIGPVLASRIVEYRDSIGGFTEVGQLRDVPGIGEKTFQALAPLVAL